MNVDVTPIMVAMVYALVPTLAVFAANLAWRHLYPELVKYLGEKNAASLQARVNELLHKAIGFGVDKAVTALQSGGGISIDPKGFVVRMALQYATSHATDLALQAGDLEEKILARFAEHPAVQQLYGPAPANGNEPPAADKAA